MILCMNYTVRALVTEKTFYLPGCIFMYLYYMYTGIWMDKTMWNRTSFFNHQLDLYNQARIALLKNKKTYTKYIKNSDVKENAF